MQHFLQTIRNNLGRSLCVYELRFAMAMYERGMSSSDVTVKLHRGQFA